MLLVLEQHRVARLATVDERGQRHVLPVCFALFHGVIYTPVDEKPKRTGVAQLRRVRNILANPRVCLVVDAYDEDWARLVWVQVRGRANLVTDEAERTAAFAALQVRYVQYRSMDLGSRPLIAITPDTVVGWSAAERDDDM